MQPWLILSVSLKETEGDSAPCWGYVLALSISLYIMYIQVIYWDIKLNLGLYIN